MFKVFAPVDNGRLVDFVAARFEGRLGGVS